MARLLLAAAILAGAFYLVNRLETRVDGVRVEGRTVRVETADLDARFTRGLGVEASYMIFGGTHEQPRNSLTHATLAALPMQHARLIQQRYPDFHLCKSPGAAQAKAYVETLSFVGTTRSARDALVDAVDLHAERIRNGGERTCVRVKGAALHLDSIRLARDGRDVTRELSRALGQTRSVLAESASLADCEALLR